MNAPAVEFEQDGLSIRLAHADGQVHVQWQGVSDSRSPATFLDPVIEQLVLAADGRPVTIDFTRLEYMNSATVTPLIQMVRALDAARCAVLLVFAEVDWQRTHFQCLRAISRTMNDVKVEARPLR
jgi:hypothetical protein